MMGATPCFFCISSCATFVYFGRNRCNLRLFSQQVDIKGIYKKLLNREWFLSEPDTKIHKVTFLPHFFSLDFGQLLNCIDSTFILNALPRTYMSDISFEDQTFYVVRDDLLHPLMGGNKIRKMDALFPFLDASHVTDVVTCGGCQSAHTAALAVACAERKMVAHLLLRGERPMVPTGYNLISGMYGHVTYVPRAEYACRELLLEKYVRQIAGSDGKILWLGTGIDEDSMTVTINSKSETVHHMDKLETKRKDMQRHGTKVAVVNEGAGNPIALLGLLRLVHFLSRPKNFGCSEKVQLVVDSGTGTTAIGLALAIVLMRLPWEVVGVMLADTFEGYERQKHQLLEGFYKQFLSPTCPDCFIAYEALLPLKWRSRERPRKFGRVLDGEIQACQHVARETGILLDPIYTLASWEMAMRMCFERKKLDGNCKVVMIHTGGTLSLFGLAQRFSSQFP